MYLKIDMNNTYTINNICTADDLHIVLSFMFQIWK